MKKYLKALTGLCVATFVLSTVAYADSEIHKFAMVSGNNNAVFTNFGFDNGEPINAIKRSPTGDENECDSLCVYNNYIYYRERTGPEEDGGNIYRCNMDGSNRTLIVNNASNYGRHYIVNDVLYYTACDTDRYYNKVGGGIYKVNLNNCSWKRIVSDLDAEIVCCDNNYVYYAVWNNGDYSYFRIDNDGRCSWKMSPDDIEIWLDYYKNGGGYVGLDNGIYSTNWDFSVVNELTLLPIEPDYDPTVLNVVNGYAYYAFSANNYFYLYRVPIWGGESEYITKCIAHE
jgi:hypothetical protein